MKTRLIACFLLLGSTAAVAQEPLTLRGKVVLHDDTPFKPADDVSLEGARVTLEPWLDDYRSGVREFLGHPEVEPIDATKSDSRGRFELRAPDLGLWVLRVEAEGYSPIYRKLGALTHPENLGNLSLRPCTICRRQTADEAPAPPPTTRRLQVLDAKGASVPGARDFRHPRAHDHTQAHGKA